MVSRAADKGRVVMFVVFSRLADALVYGVLGLQPDARFAQALHFFIEDTSKILVMLVVMIYAIALIRASLNVERVRAMAWAPSSGR